MKLILILFINLIVLFGSVAAAVLIGANIFFVLADNNHELLGKTLALTTAIFILLLGSNLKNSLTDIILK